MAVRAIDLDVREVGQAGGARRLRRRRWRWRWRWTARVRVRLAVLVLVALAAAAAVGWGAGAAHAAVRLPAAPATILVAPGDTLWGIALRHAPAGSDPRPWIFATARLNHLHDAELVPGQVLRLPAGSR